MALRIPLGAPVWIDSTTPDLARDVAFYTGLFGWKARDGGEEWGHYTELRLGSEFAGGKTVAGIVPNDPEQGDEPAKWTVSFLVEDCEAMAAKAEKFGATVVAPPMRIGDDLVYAGLLDPNGAEFGLFEPNGDEHGFEVYGETGAAAWFEYAYDGVPAEAMRFYADLFGWGLHVPPWTDPKEPRPYAALSAKGEQHEFGGCHAADGPERELPPQWTVMFGVPDADEACTMAEELGGEVVGRSAETSMVRIAEIRSPAGGVFGVISEAA